MKYNANEIEQTIIDHAIIRSNSIGAYIFNPTRAVYIYLTSSGEVKTGDKFKGEEVYHTSERVAEKFLEDWKKSKEVGAGEKEKKPSSSSKKPIKRMNQADFTKALNDI